MAIKRNLKTAEDTEDPEDVKDPKQALSLR
jgi:hypothetical protein